MKKWNIPKASTLTLAACGGGCDSASNSATSSLKGVLVNGFLNQAR